MKQLIQDANNLRGIVKSDADLVRGLMKHPDLSNDFPVAGADKGEARANIMLAFRHLEDARMRLGKAIQAVDGGVSCYDQAGSPPVTHVGSVPVGHPSTAPEPNPAFAAGDV